MAIRKIEKVYCSLGLGYIYNVNYSYNPKSGVKISLHFLNESGVYPTGFLSSSKKAKSG